MGNGNSKVSNSELVRLCKERKELIKRAGDCRYYLAKSHVLYFQSLLDVGIALDQFVIVDSSDGDSHRNIPSDSSSESVFVHNDLDLVNESQNSNALSNPNVQISENNHAYVPTTVQGSSLKQNLNVESSNRCYQNGDGEFLKDSLEMQDSDVCFSGIKSQSYTPALLLGVSSWDFFNTDSVQLDFYDSDYERDEHERDSSYFKEVRQKEGIPDLEDENLDNSGKEEPIRTREVGQSSRGETKLESNENVNPTNTKVIESKPEDIQVSSDGYVTAGSTYANSDDGSCADEADSLNAVCFTPTRNCGSGDLKEIVKEIRNACETAFQNGKEVSELLEVTKLPYQPLGVRLKGFTSRILGCGPSNVTSTQHLTCRQLKRSTSSFRNPTMGNVIDGIREKKFIRKFGDLSSTLEKLHVWENKLYDNVMVSQLSDDAIKVSVAVTTVDKISSRIHKLRDEELHLQLLELFHGLKRMWEFLATCHQKQMLAIASVKSYLHTAETNVPKNPSIKATQKLEAAMTKWGKCFSNYTKAHKSLITLLNDWLLRCILHEPDETGGKTSPFSPAKVDAPPLFTICNDWYNALKKVSETEVSNSIKDYASGLSRLKEMQVEEQQEVAKRETLLRRFEYYSVFDHDIRRNGSPVVDKEELDSLKNMIDEQNLRHEELVRKLNDAVSGCFEDCLVRIFDELGIFCREQIKAYEQVRIPKDVQGL